LFELYSMADLQIMPSWDEPYGVVCAEALAQGIPSIVTDTAGCVDLVRDGFNGYVIPPGSSRAIAERILAISTNPTLQASMKANARKSMDGLDMDNLYSMLREVIVKARRKGG
jgi:glycosyltransferase involved in cell wall biosynthesis